MSTAMDMAIKEAKALNTSNGLKLGNYHYDVDCYSPEDSDDVEIYLTRYEEECQGCKFYDEGCFGENPQDDCPASKMLPVEPYSNTYDLVYHKSTRVLEHSYGEMVDELSDIERLAVVLAAGCYDEQ